MVTIEKKRIKLVDTHCHLEDKEFDIDRVDVIKRAQNENIHIITSAIEPETWQKGLSIAELWDSVDASIGCNPINFRNADNAVEFIRANSDSIVAIGEIGLDYYYERNHHNRKQQQDAFRGFLEVAKVLRIPIQIHSRSAGKAALEVLYSAGMEMVHMHAFDGKPSLARMASNDLGYYFSIPTSVVRSPQKKKLVKAVDIEHLLLETDSPVLGPDHEKRNEPSNLLIALKEVSSILNREEEELRTLILENTLQLYSKILDRKHNS